MHSGLEVASGGWQRNRRQTNACFEVANTFKCSGMSMPLPYTGQAGLAILLMALPTRPAPMTALGLLCSIDSKA